MNQKPENQRIYLIGNPTRDRIVQTGRTVETFGGTVLYAGWYLVRSGIPVSIVGKGDKGMLAWIEAHGIGSEGFTVANRVVNFENRYEPGGRRQLAQSGEKILFGEIPLSVFQARAVLVGAVLMEVDPKVVCAPRRGMLMLDVQGFIRGLDTEGRVIFELNPALEEVINGCDILKADRLEAEAVTGTGDIRESARRLHQMGADIVVITLSSSGSGIFDGRRWIRIRAPKVKTVDPTGAGDVFGAAFLAEYLQTGDLMEAGRFGTSAAALSVTGDGTAAIPSNAQVRRAVRKHFRSDHMVTVERLSG